MTHLILDMAYSLRLLRKSPSFTALCVLVLAGGLAVSLFTFAFLYTLTNKPLPLPDQSSLYRASRDWYGEAFGESRYLPAYEAAAIRQQATVFKEHGIWQNKTVYLSQGENNLVVSAVRSTANIFDISRSGPLLGRLLHPRDSQPDQTPVAVISYAIWQSQFAGNDEVIGKQIYINDVATEIVGVMPKGYRFPISHDLWLPISQQLLHPLSTQREKVELFGRLKPGVSREQAQQQVLSLAEQSFSQRAETWPGVELIRAKVDIFQRFDVSTEMKIFSYAMNMLAFFILVLAAINVGNLLFVRAIQRNRESAIRIALGAPQWRLISQLMWEGVIITVLGTSIAVFISSVLLHAVNIYFRSLMNNELAFWYIWEMDVTVFSAALAFAVATIVIACFWPAFRAARQDFNRVLRDGTRGAQSKHAGFMSRLLVTLQISAISIIMVLGAVISTKVHNLTDMDLGYDVKGISFSIVELPESAYPENTDKSLFFERLQRALFNSQAFSGATVRFNHSQLPVAVGGVEYQRDADKPKVQVFSMIGSSEFMGPTLVAGRELDSRDGSGRAPAVLVSSSMAKRYWPNDSPIDKQIEVSLQAKVLRLNIVGVVSNTTNNPFHKKESYHEIYLSGLQFPMQRGTVFFEKTSAGVLVEDNFFRAINAIDSKLDILTIEDWELEADAIGKMTVTFRDTIVICGVFSLILAMSGIYGITAFSVEKRSQEVGVRRALGATDRKIMGLFVRQGSRQLIIGLLCGCLISGLMMFGLSSIMAIPSVVYLVIYASVIVSLTLIVLAAVIIPARRAVNLLPAVALRYE